MELFKKYSIFTHLCRTPFLPKIRMKKYGANNTWIIYHRIWKPWMKFSHVSNKFTQLESWENFIHHLHRKNLRSTIWKTSSESKMCESRNIIGTVFFVRNIFPHVLTSTQLLLTQKSLSKYTWKTMFSGSTDYNSCMICTTDFHSNIFVKKVHGPNVFTQ